MVQPECEAVGPSVNATTKLIGHHLILIGISFIPFQSITYQKSAFIAGRSHNPEGDNSLQPVRYYYVSEAFTLP